MKPTAVTAATLLILVSSTAFVSGDEANARTAKAKRVSIGIFVDKPGSFKAALEEAELLGEGNPKPTVRVYGSLEELLLADDELVLIKIPRNGPNVNLSNLLLDALKKKKVIAIGHRTAGLFYQLGLEIHGGACAHFGARPERVTIEKSLLLGRPKDEESFAPYKLFKSGEDTAAMHIPPQSDLRAAVDVIARFARNKNYAPIVRQREYVLIGLDADAASWSPDFRSLFLKVTAALLAREKRPFELPQFVVQPPGVVEFELDRKNQTSSSSKIFHFKFEVPTEFVVKLEHEGSKSLMMLFAGQKRRRGFRRLDSKDGTPLNLESRITASDIEALGDRYWELDITNFDRTNPVKCKLTITYDQKR